MPSSVGAVVVNYNAGDHLLACVNSLEAEGVNDVVVVDNGSTDGSIQKLKDKFPQIATLMLPNPGYGTAMNRGAAQLKSEFVFVLNPDTVVGPGVIKTLLADMEANENLGIVGPRLEDSDGSLYPSARQFPSFVDAVGHAVLGIFWANNPWSKRYKMLAWDHETALDVDWVSGAAMFCRKAAYDSIGGFDESYFMYMEDVDLCWRLRKSDWTVAYEPAATVMHVRGVSTDPSPYRFIVAHHRSLLRYNVRTASGLSRVLLPVVVVGLVARVPLACLHRFFVGHRRPKTSDSAPESSESAAPSS